MALKVATRAVGNTAAAEVPLAAVEGRRVIGIVTAHTADLEARGWQQWRGPTAVLAPDGLTRTEEDDGGVYVLLGAARLDLDGELTCDWRDGEVW